MLSKIHLSYFQAPNQWCFSGTPNVVTMTFFWETNSTSRSAAEADLKLENSSNYFWQHYSCSGMQDLRYKRGFFWWLGPFNMLVCNLPWNSPGWWCCVPSWGAAPLLTGPQVVDVVRRGRQIFLIKIQVKVGCHVVMRPLILRNLLSFNYVGNLHILQLRHVTTPYYAT